MWSTATQSFTQIYTPFGSSYVQEHCNGEISRGNLAPAEDRLTIDFGAMLARLRAALWLR
jgi:hypothetical protein